MGMTSLVEERIGQGWHMCACHALSRPERDQCFQCGRSFAPAAASPADTGKAPATRRRPKKATPNRQAGRSQTGYGSLTDPVDLTVMGLPVSQGSGVAAAPGVFKHVNGAELRAWRDKITRVARETLGGDWVAPNAPTSLIAVFTVPAPERVSTGSEADGYRDIDKLLRAVNDGLCPSGGFRTIASDMRHVETIVAKTFPQGVGTHPLALPQPGVWLRLQRSTPPTVIDGVWTIAIPLPVGAPR